jgi:hypothetical protein
MVVQRSDKKRKLEKECKEYCQNQFPKNRKVNKEERPASKVFGPRTLAQELAGAPF